jgi:hypothetical protein
MLPLFTSINVPRVVDYIISKMYECPKNFFGENDLLDFPPILIFKYFMIIVLLKLGAFSTLNGYYRQIEGLAMGSKLSPALSNILLHMLELTIIESFKAQKTIIFHTRYVDDCLLMVQKRTKNAILEK